MVAAALAAAAAAARPLPVAGRPPLASTALQLPLNFNIPGAASQANKAYAAAAAAGKVTPAANMAKVITSCHQCKNAREDIAHCTKLYTSGVRRKKPSRTCKKKYCDRCLLLFYNATLKEARTADWKCPACTYCNCLPCD
jgi:hypothetical protein